MSKPDILERLGNHAAVTMFDVDDAAEEIKKLRCEVAVLHRRVHVAESLRLTDAERQVLVRAWHGLLKLGHHEPSLIDKHLADARALNAFLERTRNG